MLIADETRLIYDEQGGDAPQFEDIPFLTV